MQKQTSESLKNEPVAQTEHKPVTLAENMFLTLKIFAAAGIILGVLWVIDRYTS